MRVYFKVRKLERVSINGVHEHCERTATVAVRCLPQRMYTPLLHSFASAAVLERFLRRVAQLCAESISFMTFAVNGPSSSPHHPHPFLLLSLQPCARPRKQLTTLYILSFVLVSLAGVLIFYI